MMAVYTILISGWRFLKRNKPGLQGSIIGIALLASLATAGFSGEDGTMLSPAWVNRVKTSINGAFDNEKSLATFGRTIIGMLHPTGINASLDDIRYVEASQGRLIVQFDFSWKGKFTGSEYKTVVNWIASEEGHLGGLVDSDTAPTSSSKEAQQKLDDYFKNIFIKVLEDMPSPKTAKHKSRKGKAKALDPKSAISAIRSALQKYYEINEGVFPTDIKELTPKFLTGIPYIAITPTNVTNTAAYPTTTNKDVCGSVTNSGGWLYFNNPEDLGKWGTITIDSVEVSPDGRRWCEY